MNTEQFLRLLQRDGFPEPVEVQQSPNGYLDEHEHPFEVRALVIEGSITIITNSQNAVYKAGEIFQLSFKKPHAESYGPEGVKYLASRKE
ncbi:cupin [Polynucleobacter sp. JS-Safj-400b-B2]|jgi:quercetin dioxygenase-like cupin family protein|uniref:cupin domain-containing protein n=1 Tax=Polynucleobacter sp. JS-Safj-400b-B2 TaxID=2576921 RepID=UPI001C0C7338|nr:cupin [Polynucleobacter sp. JS-Safj-400b-B2]MBU3624899.1 cupin [Polynucleobacter sp. JS-Safj-400b-B2]